MKPIEQLNNVESAKLLFDLFPKEIAPFTEFVKGMCLTVQEEKETQRELWEKNGFYSFDYWLGLVSHVDDKIKHYGKKLHKSSRLFSDQLFDGTTALYSLHCLHLYITQSQHPNKKFVLMVEVLTTP